MSHEQPPGGYGGPPPGNPPPGGYGPPGQPPGGYGPPGQPPGGYGPPGQPPGGYGPPGQPPGGYGPPGYGGPPNYGAPGGFPPGGYPPPGGYGGAPPPGRPQRRPIELRQSGVIRERSALSVVLLSVFTCGIYYLIWLHSTTSELRDALGDEEIKPTQDLLLTIFTCFLWSIYVEYRNAQKVHAALLSRDPYIKDQSEMVILLNVAALFVGMTWLVATYILQEELNKLSKY